MTRWVCTSCGLETEGVNPPKKCSSCGSGKEAFEIMEERETNERGEEIQPEEEDWDEEIEADDDFD